MISSLTPFSWVVGVLSSSPLFCLVEEIFFNNPAKPFPSDATGGSLLLCGSSPVCAGVSFRASWTHLSTIAGSGSYKKLILKRGSMKQTIFMTFFALSVPAVKVFSHDPFHLLSQGWVVIMFHQYLTGDVVQDRLDG